MMDIGLILSSMPPIVENIFKYLNRRDLDSCAAVCELWKRVAQTEKNSREDIFWFFQEMKCVIHKEFHSSCRNCPVDDDQTIESDIQGQLKDLKLKPYFCFSFITLGLLRQFERFFPSFRYPPHQSKRAKYEDISKNRYYLKRALRTAVGQYLSEKCKKAFVITPGIIGSYPDCQPLEIEDGFAISGLMIPAVPGLDIFNLPVDEKNFDISKQIPASSSIKCLLVFVTYFDSTFPNKIIENCLLRENFELVVGGALVERSESHRGSVVAFCGERVEAASIVIKRTGRAAEVEKKLELFKKTGLLNDKCFAFMFVCVARGFSIYSEYNLESSIFHKLYPTVPLFGVFGNGEIGIDYLPNVPNESQICKLPRCRKRYIHSYSTVFVLVSVKM